MSGAAKQSERAERFGGQPTLAEALERLERDMIVTALLEARGNRARAARLLGLTERVMGLRVRKYGICSKEFRRRAS